MLINLTNHPYSEWTEKQKLAAAEYGECIDIRFPNISPDAEEGEINKLVDTYLEKIKTYSAVGSITVHIMGEHTFCFSLISRMLKLGIRCIASCTSRDVSMEEDGSKQVRFHFSRFREYSF